MSHRLLIVARRFWPFCDETSQRLLAWAATLQNEGFEITILTGRWNTSWPAESQLREMKVVRLLPAPKSSWNETLFLRNVATWIAKHRSSFDAIYVDESAGLLHLIVNPSTSAELPVFGRFGGITFDVLSYPYYKNMLQIATDACRKATKVIVPHSIAQKQLLASGIPASNIVRIPDMPWNPVIRSPDRRATSARALRDINSDLQLPNKIPLLVYFGVTDEANATEFFLRAAMRLLDQDYLVRIWMMGVGRKLAELYDIVKFESHHRDIYFHGVFDSIEEIYQVADGLMILPGNGLEYFAPKAIACSLPVLATSTRESLATFPPLLQPSLGEDVTAFESAHYEATGSELQREKAIGVFYDLLKGWIEQPSQWEKRAREVKQNFVQSNIMAECLREWAHTLKSL